MAKFNKKVPRFLMLVLVATMFSSTVRAELIDNSKEQYIVSEGTIYWESSTGNGSGKHNTVCQENQYTDVSRGEFPVWVDGYSVLDSDGNIVEVLFNEKTQKIEVPMISSNQQLMIHIWGVDEENHRLGWILYSDLRKSNYIISEIPEGKEGIWFNKASEKTVEQMTDTLRKEIEADSKINRKSVILADCSGSMYEFQMDILENLDDIAETSYVFAESIEEFSTEKDSWSYNIGGATDIANALNTVNISDNTHIYLLTDLDNNFDTKIENNNFEGEITIVYYPSFFWNAVSFCEELRQAYPNAKLTGF